MSDIVKEGREKVKQAITEGKNPKDIPPRYITMEESAEVIQFLEKELETEMKDRLKKKGFDADNYKNLKFMCL